MSRLLAGSRMKSRKTRLECARSNRLSTLSDRRRSIDCTRPRNQSKEPATTVSVSSCTGAATSMLSWLCSSSSSTPLSGSSSMLAYLVEGGSAQGLCDPPPPPAPP
eukprot:158368-Hanusia_phi.AAC.3